jgi:catechol 2,3-dioxygenase-like lactoylglutathione lyase family enzyme
MATGALPPPPDIVRCVYAELVVTDLARARWFWVDVLGFVVTESGPGVLADLLQQRYDLRRGAEVARCR